MPLERPFDAPPSTDAVLAVWTMLFWCAACFLFLFLISTRKPSDYLVTELDSSPFHFDTSETLLVLENTSKHRHHGSQVLRRR